MSGTEQKLFKKWKLIILMIQLILKLFIKRKIKRFTNIQLNKAKTKLENRFEGKPDEIHDKK